MCRALITDPAWPKKAREGRALRAARASDLFEGARAIEQAFEEAQTHAAQQNLRMHKSGHEFEQARCPPAHETAHEGEGGGATVQAGRGHEAVAPGLEAAPQTAGGGGQRRGGVVQGVHAATSTQAGTRPERGAW